MSYRIFFFFAIADRTRQKTFDIYKNLYFAYNNLENCIKAQ
jgi:hypothetical protein